MSKKTRKAIEELDKDVTKAQKRNAKLFEEWAERIVEALEEQAESNRELTRTLQSYLDASGGRERSAETRSPAQESTAPDERTSDSRRESAPESSTESSMDQEATDAAERKARELGVDLDEVEGTGSGGRIVVGDVEEAAD